VREVFVPTEPIVTPPEKPQFQMNIKNHSKQHIPAESKPAVKTQKTPKVAKAVKIKKEIENSIKIENEEEKEDKAIQRKMDERALQKEFDCQKLKSKFNDLIF
jgi:hypothetical protein